MVFYFLSLGLRMSSPNSATLADRYLKLKEIETKAEAGRSLSSSLSFFPDAGHSPSHAGSTSHAGRKEHPSSKDKGMLRRISATNKAFLVHEIGTLSAFSASCLLSRSLVIRPRTRSEHWGPVIPLGLISSCHVKCILDNCVCFSLVILSPSS